jgi:hypothetical protein
MAADPFFVFIMSFPFLLFAAELEIEGEYHDR